MTTDHLPHLMVEGFFTTEKYTAAPRRGPEFTLPARDSSHSEKLRTELASASEDNAARRSNGSDAEEPPIQLVVESDPDHLLSIESLDLQSEGIEVVSAKVENGVHIAVVHVPPGKLLHFRKRIEEFETQQTRKGSPKNQKLIVSISRIRLATIEHLWTDDSAFPAQTEKIWWEVWVRKLGGQNIWSAFRVTAESTGVGLTVGKDTIEFPDRIVGLVFGTIIVAKDHQRVGLLLNPK